MPSIALTASLKSIFYRTTSSSLLLPSTRGICAYSFLVKHATKPLSSPRTSSTRAPSICAQSTSVGNNTTQNLYLLALARLPTYALHLKSSRFNRLHLSSTIFRFICKHLRLPLRDARWKRLSPWRESFEASFVNRSPPTNTPTS